MDTKNRIALQVQENNKDKQLGIYIHIPFCVQKCAYCDFLSNPANEDTKISYVNALMKELKFTAATEDLRGYCVKSVFIGGGTPSILSTDCISRIMECLYEQFHIDKNAEISIECNPGTVDKEKMECYKKSGINRLSFGLQSAQDHELETLGRIHTFAEFCESFGEARACGFDNINVDLMSAIPNQSFASWKDTLQKIIALQPEHVSAYSLILEENTELYRRNQKKSLELPDEDTERKMYYYTNSSLQEAGYEHYEISNYAKRGFVCVHNLSYWDRIDYLGFGIGAASLLKETRYSNISDMKKYIQLFSQSNPCLDMIRADKSVLSINDRMEEFMFLGLRKTQGISINEFEETFGKTLAHVYGDVIQKYMKLGLLHIQGEFLMLTEKGNDVSNVIMSEFLL